MNTDIYGYDGEQEVDFMYESPANGGADSVENDTLEESKEVDE